MIPKKIIDLFGDRWNPAGTSDFETLHNNIEAALDELRTSQILVRRLSAAHERERQPAAPPSPPTDRELPGKLAASPAICALDVAADGAICWPTKPTRAFLSNVVAYLNTVDGDKQDFCRRLGVVLKARRDTRCWPCRGGRPVDAVTMFFSRPMFDQLAAAAGKVK